MSRQTSPGEKLHGSVERVLFHNEENGYSVLRVILEGGLQAVTVTGNIPGIVAGEGITAAGDWKNVRNYGRQFVAKELRSTPPGSPEGIEKYLASGHIKGVGATYAKKIVERFGAETLEVIDKSSARLEEIEGIGPKRRREIKESWQAQKQVHGVMVFLHEHGVGTARAARIQKAYGDDALQVLREDPYRMVVDLDGVGFKTADQIATQVGLDPNSISRVRAGLIHVMDNATSSGGHTATPRSELVSSAQTLLAVGEDACQQALDELLGEAELFAEQLAGADLVFASRLRGAEVRIATQLKMRSAQPSSLPPVEADTALRWVSKKTGIELAPGQEEAVREALVRPVLVVTGGPGVGKTTVLDSILRVLGKKGVDAVLCAPTGRAARRMAEGTRQDAFTIHRLLEYQGGVGFKRNRSNRLDGQLFVVDESSMIDTTLMASFLEALPDDAHLLLVGDNDQLPSVGPGRVLGDIIESGAVPVVRLTEIYRQAAASRIVSSAHAVNAGNLPDLAPDPASDFFWVEKEAPTDVLRMMEVLLRDRFPQKFGFDPIRDVQVLTPMNRGPLGTVAMNERLQQVLNPGSEYGDEFERGDRIFRRGDKVIQTRNNYDEEVFNGDIGFVIAIQSDPVQVVVEFEGGRRVGYAPEALDQIQLAYAITIHRSQGSEFPAVLVPVSTQHFVMLRRNLLYTGITRGKQAVVLVGQEKALRMAVETGGEKERVTGLAERLRGVI